LSHACHMWLTVFINTADTTGTGTGTGNGWPRPTGSLAAARWHGLEQKPSTHQPLQLFANTSTAPAAWVAGTSQTFLYTNSETYITVFSLDCLDCHNPPPSHVHAHVQNLDGRVVTVVAVCSLKLQGICPCVGAYPQCRKAQA
jgi:hypothetical protein